MKKIVYGTDVVFDYAVLMTDILGKSKKARYMRAFLRFIGVHFGTLRCYMRYINGLDRYIYRSKATV